MAVTPMGAAAPAPDLPSLTSTRTRRYHGVTAIGDDVLLLVSTSRRSSDWPGVSLEAGDVDEPGLYFAGSMSAEAARSLARALLRGAEAADLAGRRPPVDRRPAQSKTGGAA